MNRTGWMALLLAVAGAAHAGPPMAARKAMEASMLVTGEILVDAQGNVSRYEIDKREKIPAGVQKFLDEGIAAWQFEPGTVDGRAAAARNRMSLLLVAQPIDEENIRMELRSTSFFPIKPAGYELEPVDMDPPSYPMLAAQLGVSGTVYLALKIGADGKVEDVVSEQVNLRNYGSASEMNRWRSMLAHNAAAKARQWRFRPPHQGDQADDGTWSVRVPVAYSFDRGQDNYGRWQGYMPGPLQRAPWATDDDVVPDALADGALYPIGKSGGLRLLPQQRGS